MSLSSPASINSTGLDLEVASKGVRTSPANVGAHGVLAMKRPVVIDRTFCGPVIDVAPSNTRQPYRCRPG